VSGTRAARLLRSAAPVALALLAAACSKPVAPPAEGSDGPHRVVSLAPSLTDTLVALGLADRIVGVSDYCPDVGTKPPPVRVGGLNNLNVEAVLALHPDLVMSVQNPGDRTLVAFAERGVALYTDDPQSLPQVFASIEAIGGRFHRGAPARELTARLRERLARVAAAHAGTPRPRVFIEVDAQGPWSVGRRSFVRDALVAAGGDNLFDDVESPYPTVSEEAVAARDPDWILLLHPPDVAFEQRGAFARLRAVREGRVISDLDRDLLLHSSPRLVDGVEALAARLHAR
jgi:iron complex transport system substrate-binding protein